MSLPLTYRSPTTPIPDPARRHLLRLLLLPAILLSLLAALLVAAYLFREFGYYDYTPQPPHPADLVRFGSAFLLALLYFLSIFAISRRRPAGPLLGMIPITANLLLALAAIALAVRDITTSNVPDELFADLTIILLLLAMLGYLLHALRLLQRLRSTDPLAV